MTTKELKVTSGRFDNPYVETISGIDNIENATVRSVKVTISANDTDTRVRKINRRLRGQYEVSVNTFK